MSAAQLSSQYRIVPQFDTFQSVTRALLAKEQDGKRLPALRLTVPGDSHGGRYVTDVTSIDVPRIG